jgi:hypothetical protein
MSIIKVEEQERELSRLQEALEKIDEIAFHCSVPIYEITQKALKKEV